MERTALVTGSPTRVQDVGEAMEKAGFAVIRATVPGGLEEACRDLSPGTLSCYVQLPRETEVRGPSLVQRVRQFLAEGLLARFESAAQVMPYLASDACVVLVAGNVPGEATPDDRHARIDLLRVLARAVLAERPEDDVRAVVAGFDRSPDEIAEIAWRRGDDQSLRRAEVAALDPGLDYADWQREVLSLTTDEQ
jgi:hypothetical protein